MNARIHSFIQHTEHLRSSLSSSIHALEPEGGHETGNRIKWLHLGDEIEGWEVWRQQEMGALGPCSGDPGNGKVYPSQ